VPAGSALIVAGNTIVAAGGNTVTTVDLDTKKPSWSAEVDAEALGLAAADGRLFVSTASGAIHCFAATRPDSPRVHRAAAQEFQPVADETIRAAADEIIRKSGITEGYCLDLGCGDGALAYELARRTDLYIVAVDSSAENVAAARQRLDDAGLYGTRATVHQVDLTDTHLPKFFANLIISGRSLSAGADAVDAQELKRLQRPYGGVACIGKAGELAARTRGSLEGAGQWTHQYGDAANTLCSDDEVKGPLSVLWFRDVDLDLPQRHGRGPSPLFHDGRMFVEGLDGLRAVDAYNGRSLWHHEVENVLGAYDADHLAGTAITGSNFCVAGESVFLRHADRCERIDAATGRTLREYRLPGENGAGAEWGYIACVDGVLFGSIANCEHVVRHAYRPADELMKQQFSESSALFALDVESGELLWRYDAKHSIRHNALAVGGGRVFLIDRPLATMDLLSRAVRRGEPQPAATSQPTGELVVLDAKTGERRWSDDKDVYGTTLAYSGEHDLLLMCYQPTRFKLPSEVGGRMRVYRADEGYTLWDKAVKYSTRPLINGRRIIAHPSAVDLLTGESYPFAVAKSYGCGQVCGSKHLLMFRSGTLGYFDLSRDAGTENFGGIRPGCWINTLAVGGLVLVPDASAGCRCSYQNRSWVALEGAE
jgi:outer membrane protein assembly factor BamB